MRTGLHAQVLDEPDRMKLTLNPFVMMKQLLGPKLFNKGRKVVGGSSPVPASSCARHTRATVVPLPRRGLFFVCLAHEHEHSLPLCSSLTGVVLCFLFFYMMLPMIGSDLISSVVRGGASVFASVPCKTGARHVSQLGVSMANTKSMLPSSTGLLLWGGRTAVGAGLFVHVFCEAPVRAAVSSC